MAAAASLKRVLLRQAVPSTRQRFTPALARSYAVPTNEGPSFVNPAHMQYENLMAEAFTALNESNQAKAIATYRQAAAINPDSFTPLYNLGILQHETGKTDEAIKTWKEALEQAKGISKLAKEQEIELADLYTNIASALMVRKGSNKEDRKQGLSYIRMASKYNAEDGEVAFNHGVLAELEEVYDEAVQAYERAVKLGVERAQQNLRNVGGKLMRQRMEQTAAGTDRAQHKE